MAVQVPIMHESFRSVTIPGTMSACLARGSGIFLVIISLGESKWFQTFLERDQICSHEII